LTCFAAKVAFGESGWRHGMTALHIGLSYTRTHRLSSSWLFDNLDKMTAIALARLNRPDQIVCFT